MFRCMERCFSWKCQRLKSGKLKNIKRDKEDLVLHQLVMMKIEGTLEEADPDHLLHQETNTREDLR